MTCRELAGSPEEWVLLPEDAPERRQAERHAASCAACAARLREARALLAGVDDALDLPGPAPEVLASGRRRLDEAFAAERRAPVIHGIAGAGVLLAFLVIAGRHLTHGALGAPALLVVAALATAVAAFSRRTAWPAVGLATGASIASAAWSGDGATLDVVVGFVCVAKEMLAGGVALAGLWLADRRAETLRLPTTWAAVAGAGALAGQAGLLLGCPATGAGHGLVFHVAGVALAGGFALVVQRRRVARVVAG